MINIRKLEAELWESADLLRQGSKLTSNQYCMPVLALLFLRYAYSRYKMVEAEILQSRPMRGGRVMPVEPSDFAAKSALYLPKEAQFDYLVNLPDNIIAAGLKNKDGNDINSLGEAVNSPSARVAGFEVWREWPVSGCAGTLQDSHHSGDRRKELLSDTWCIRWCS